MITLHSTVCHTVSVSIAHVKETDIIMSFIIILKLPYCQYKNEQNKVGYTATLVAYWWAGAVLEFSRASGQEPYAQKAQKR